MPIQKPMLAAKLEPEDLKNLRYPLLATPKLDGIRCLIVNGKAVSRKFKPIPNKFIRTTIERFALEGFDGEIVLEGKEFNEISSAVMSEDGEPDFTYAVFDLYSSMTCGDEGYTERMKNLSSCPHLYKIQYVLPSTINNELELQTFEDICLKAGYEGIILRSPNSPYKFGRSTLKEQYLMKFKRFTDGEAVILSLYEKMHNTNEATTDNLGHTKRSSHLANQIPAGTLGGFCVRDLKSNEEFNIGTGKGLNDVLRQEIWNKSMRQGKNLYVGKIIKFKSQKSGKKDKPRFPTFIGFRDEMDM